MILQFFTFDLWRSHMVDALGLAASGATLCAFAQKQMLPMRVSAIAANLFFIAYGAIGLLYPVLLLHLVLLPLNIGRLLQQLAQDKTASTTSEEKRGPTLVEEWRSNRMRFSYAAANLIPDQPLDAANAQASSRRLAS